MVLVWVLVGLAAGLVVVAVLQTALTIASLFVRTVFGLARQATRFLPSHRL
jgi:hypothetical protein